MKGYLIHAPWFLNIFGEWIGGMTIFPFIITREKKPSIFLLNHERIHLRQQAELLLIFFAFMYFGHMLLNLLKYRNFAKAYRDIVFEQEAYRKEYDLSYLKNRKFFGWARA